MYKGSFLPKRVRIVALTFLAVTLALVATVASPHPTYACFPDDAHVCNNSVEGPPIITQYQALGPTMVKIAWYPQSDQVTNNTVTRSPGCSPCNYSWHLANYGENDLADPTVHPNTTYTYTLCAWFGEKSYCSTATVTTPPAQPQSNYGSPVVITSFTANSSSITMHWASSYNYGVYLLRWGRQGFPDQQIPNDITGHSYTFSGLSANTTYTFKVEGCDLGFWFGTHLCPPNGWAVASFKTNPPPTTPDQIYTDVTGGTPVFGDTFGHGNTNGWSVNNNCVFSGAAYHVKIAQHNTFEVCYARPTFSNFAFEAQMTILSGDFGGIVFRTNQGHPFGYRFAFGSLGSDNLVYDRELANFRTSPIKAHLNQSYVLLAIVRGSNILLYINRVLVANVNDSSASAGGIGLMAGDFSHPADVAFSGVWVWKL